MVLDSSPRQSTSARRAITDDGDKDDSAKPFLSIAKLPPIRIWRYLVEEKGVDPKDIAIYANLTFISGNKPDEVNLFSQGENDFDDFYSWRLSAQYSFSIFSLQEEVGMIRLCYLAYIDKSMGSSIQVEGRS